MDDVTTAEDWPPGGMRELDQALRCPICFDLFENPVMMPECLHAFCSLCVRRALGTEEACPACRKPVQANGLRPVRPLAIVAQLYRRERAGLLDATRNEARSKASPARRQTAHSRPAVIDLDSDAESPTGGARAGPVQSPDTPSTARTATSDTVVTPTTLQPAPPLQQQQQQAEAVAATLPCPVCGKAIIAQQINEHLDACLSGQGDSVGVAAARADPPAASTTPAAPRAVSPLLAAPAPLRKPKPKVPYAVLSDKQLKQLLRECGLSIHGDRHLLEWRHKEFVLRYNADCDSLRPKRQEELVREVEAAERNRLQDRSARTAASASNVRPPAGSDVSSGDPAYVAEHKGSFDALIASLRSRAASNGNAAASGGSADSSDEGQASPELGAAPAPPRSRRLIQEEQDDDAHAWQEEEEKEEEGEEEPTAREVQRPRRGRAAKRQQVDLQDDQQEVDQKRSTRARLKAPAAGDSDSEVVLELDNGDDDDWKPSPASKRRRTRT